MNGIIWNGCIFVVFRLFSFVFCLCFCAPPRWFAPTVVLRRGPRADRRWMATATDWKYGRYDTVDLLHAKAHNYKNIYNLTFANWQTFCLFVCVVGCVRVFCLVMRRVCVRRVFILIIFSRFSCFAWFTKAVIRSLFCVVVVWWPSRGREEVGTNWGLVQILDCF